MSGDPKPRVVILNDTSGRSHHGCARVMRLLIAGIERQGLAVSYRVPAHSDWRKDTAAAAAIAAADLVVINGEGTLHHGRPAGEALLRVIPEARARGTPVALINALWEENPPEWTNLLAQADLVSARDSASAAVMRGHLGESRVRMVPDLSLSAGGLASDHRRSAVIFGDSVRWSVRRNLARAARRLGADALVPTKTRASLVWTFAPTRELLSGVYFGAAPFTLPPLRLAGDETAYLRALQQSAIMVSGRFHAICLALVTGTPFLAVGSNTGKIETLLRDAGLGVDRLIPADRLDALEPLDLVRPFSAQELKAISAFLENAKSGAEALFADLARLSRGEAP